MTTAAHLAARIQGRGETGDVSRFWVWFAGIVALGAVLRFWDLAGAPIWMDEAVTLGFARLDLSTIVWGNIDNHPNLTWLIQHVWHRITPDPDLARVPAATFGALTVAALVLAVRDMAGARAAVIAGLLFACATGHIYYSQDARMYPYLMFGLVLALWGGVGHARRGRHGAATYAALYVVGGLFAIYSHALGLIAMGLIGFSSLAAGWMTPERWVRARQWFAFNAFLFVLTLPWLIALPSATGTFPGLGGDNSPFDIQWFFRNITGFPGLGGPAIVFEAGLYLAAAAALPLAWMRGRRALALALGALLVLFPLIILGLHLRQPLLANKVLIPGIIPVVIGAGYTLSRLAPRPLATACAALLVLAAFTSSAVSLRHNIKPENYAGAFAFAEARGFRDAPALTCVHFHSAAAWENRRDGRTLFYRRGDVLDYHGPAYWQAAGRTMTWLRAAEAAEIDEALGGGWLIPGGLAGALAGEDQVIFVRPSCPAGREAEIIEGLRALGFAATEETLARGRAAEFTILEEPQPRVTLFAR
ncbi:MAG: glycosyltransferase family 39 protein [Pseudomonadota bacterium]